LKGQQHYSRSERLAKLAAENLEHEGLDAKVTNLIALAQVHATLAVAATTAGGGGGWRDVLDAPGPAGPPPSHPTPEGLPERRTPRY